VDISDPELDPRWAADYDRENRWADDDEFYVVAWIRGTASDAPSAAFDLALMTSHVAQEFISDADWSGVLADLKRCLVPGGRLAFESRDPGARAWERWALSFGGDQRSVLPDGTVLDTSNTTSYENEVFEAETYSILSDGSVLHRPVEQELTPGTTWSRARWAYRFRSVELIRDSLEEAGFAVDRLYGGWKGEPVGTGEEIVVVARA
jgi:SAM-dependent methyltransferase